MINRDNDTIDPSQYMDFNRQQKRPLGNVSSRYIIHVCTIVGAIYGLMWSGSKIYENYISDQPETTIEETQTSGLEKLVK